jgi:Carboxypeptidase regulatory-like domain
VAPRNKEPFVRVRMADKTKVRKCHQPGIGNRAFHFSLAPLIVILLALNSYGHSQTTSGSIVGSLTDQSAAVVSDTRITLTNINTTVVLTAVTNNSGFYQFVNVPPGKYQVSVEKQGFKRFSRGPIDLQVGTTIQINITLQLGSETQQVVVTTQTPLIQSETTSLGTVVDQRQTNEIPLNGRNPMSLAALVPSVVPQSQSQENPAQAEQFGNGNYQIGGGIAGQSATYLDGSPVMVAYTNLMSLVPTQDSLAEFKVETNNLSPEYGRLAGGAINFETKSGGNVFHGNAWEYIRNRLLNANTYFGNLAGLPRPAFTQNQYGFNIGGPLIIPHLYNGRDKTFFFVNWEGLGLRQGQTYTETVPTALERTGNLSALGVPIYNPLTTCGVTGGPGCAPGVSLYNRVEYPGATIPSSQLNPTALAYLKEFYPLPNTAGVNGQNNFTATADAGGNNQQAVVRIDQNVSAKQHVSARYTYWTNTQIPVNPLGTGACFSACTLHFNNNDFVIDDSYSFNPKTVLDIRFSYLRYTLQRTPLLTNFDLTSIAMPESLQASVQFHTAPPMNISGFDPAGIFSSNGLGSLIKNFNDNERVAGTLTKFLGNHAFTFGGEFLRQTLNYIQTNNAGGSFTFNNSFTAANPTTAVGGAGLASFLLGYAASGSIAFDNMTAGQQLYPAVFANDVWHAGARLTLNLGLRWEDNRPWTERHNRLSYFDPSATNPILLAAGLGNVPGALELVASSTRSSRSNVNNYLAQFSPRVGLSYELSPTTVVSAGYGIFWLPEDVVNGLEPNNDIVNSGNTPFVSSINNGLTPLNNISNPFPQGIILPAGRNPSYQQTFLGANVSATLVNNPFAYAQQWNMGVQQQLGRRFVLDIAYGGAKGTHLPFSSLPINQLPDQDLSLGNALNASVPNPYLGTINSGYSLGTATVPAGQLLLKYPEYNGVSSLAADLANSSYNSMQIKAQERFSNGASINVAYTWSKLLSDTDSLTTWLDTEASIQDSNNLRGEKSLSSNDTPQRLVVSYVYDIPVGKGRKYLATSSRLVDSIVGGWGLGGVTTLQSGWPLQFTTNVNLTSSFGGGSRPNYVPGCAKEIQGSATSRLNEWFNTSCFTQPPAFTFGGESRTDPQLRDGGVADWDTSAFKNFGITEKINMQFRAEVYNLANRVQFGYPGMVTGESTFGVVSSQANLPRIWQFALRVSY